MEGEGNVLYNKSKKSTFLHGNSAISHFSYIYTHSKIMNSIISKYKSDADWKSLFLMWCGCAMWKYIGKCRADGSHTACLLAPDADEIEMCFFVSQIAIFLYAQTREIFNI
jgi:hypothetical protein